VLIFGIVCDLAFSHVKRPQAQSNTKALTDTSNPTHRVLAVLNFLGANPTESFTLTEIARHVGLSNGSAHRILTTMAESRFLSRNEKHRTYSLGIALVALGRAALEKHRGIEIARKEIAQLALELNAQCSVTAIADGELLLVAKEGAPQSNDGVHQVGERMPLVLPIAIGHIAWRSAQVIESYLAEASPHLSKALRKHAFAAISAIRRRGYAMAANGPAMRGLRQAMISTNGYIQNDAHRAAARDAISTMSEDELQLLDIPSKPTTGLRYLAAPVFSPDGSVSLELITTGLPSNLGAKEIERYAERLCAAAAVVTGEVHGRYPSSYE
jgi:DNA-binding IclR family transcriptional regulator